jgi:hypothetical protein
VPAGPYFHLWPGTNRLIVKAMREPPSGSNNFADDIEAEAYATPRGLVVPGG